MELNAAKFGGVSDPRNGTLLKLFNMIDIGERSGSGIPKILSAWKAQGRDEPTIAESFDPERTVLSLPFGKSADKKVLIKNDDKKVLIKTSAQKEQIIAYLTDHPRAATAELCELLDVKPTRVRNLLRELAAEDIVVAEGGKQESDVSIEGVSSLRMGKREHHYTMLYGSKRCKRAFLREDCRLFP